MLKMIGSSVKDFVVKRADQKWWRMEAVAIVQ